METLGEESRPGGNSTRLRVSCLIASGDVRTASSPSSRQPDAKPRGDEKRRCRLRIRDTIEAAYFEIVKVEGQRYVIPRQAMGHDAAVLIPDSNLPGIKACGGPLVPGQVVRTDINRVTRRGRVAARRRQTSPRAAPCRRVAAAPADKGGNSSRFSTPSSSKICVGGWQTTARSRSAH